MVYQAITDLYKCMEKINKLHECLSKKKTPFITSIFIARAKLYKTMVPKNII